MTLLTSFAAISLLLTVVGLYGVLAYSVIRRTREIGVRIAVGAGHGEVVSLVLKKAVVLVALGIALGLAGAFATGRLLSQMLYGVPPNDPSLLAMASCIIAATAIAAAYLPARRAASIDPIRALRAD
jgi:ABC-type antimicrobial peptide transport system permease subunit